MSKVIKSGPGHLFDSRPLLLSPDSFEEEIEAKLDPDNIISRAKQQCELIVRTAESEARALMDSAYADGYDAGIKAADRSFDELFGELQAAIEQESQERAELVDSIEEHALTLCVDIAEKIIRHEIKTTPQVVARTLKMCLRRLKVRDEATVRVNPAEVAHLRATRDELLSAAEHLRELNIVDDRRISAGGCVVESPSGEFDARIETQMEQIRRKLMDAFNNEFSQTNTEPAQIPGDDKADGHLPD
ncbi:MAG: hypothetical protein GX139_11785 [Armatimonadetes bacterium]|jgi:flagellar assembly protein FliH|nr:hypothetical protein [Armatimonadota bacterium]